jgi:hypothetical protein
MNTTPESTATYNLVGDGVASGEISYNPETEEVTYIHQDSGVTTLNAYKPNMPIEGTAIDGDPVFEFVDSLRKSRAILDAAKTDIVNVWLYETPVGDAYPAEKQEVIISIDSFGGEGGKPATIKYTINYAGDAILGTFDPTTKAWTAA